MLNLVQDKSIRLMKGNVEGLNQENVKIKISSTFGDTEKKFGIKKSKIRNQSKNEKICQIKIGNNRSQV
jgi:hypothetical protein